MVSSDEIRRYLWTDSPLAKGSGGLTSDALAMMWLEIGTDLSFVQGAPGSPSAKGLCTG